MFHSPFLQMVWAPQLDISNRPFSAGLNTRVVARAKSKFGALESQGALEPQKSSGTPAPLHEEVSHQN